MLAIKRLSDSRRHLFTTRSGEWWRSYRDAFQFTEEVRSVRRLVVTAWLPYHRIAILMIVPQRVVAPRSRSRSGIDADIVATRSLYHFLTPVTKDITLIARGSLGTIVGISTRECCQRSDSWFGNSNIVEALLLQVTIPIDTEVLSQSVDIDTDMVISHSRYRRIMRTITYRTRNVVIEVTSQASTRIVGIGHTIINLAGSCVTIVVGRSILITSEHFLTMDVRIQVADVGSITMTKSCCRKTLTIVINHHGTPDDLVTTIPIDIGDGIVVIALSIPRRTRLIVGPLPTHVESMSRWIDIVSDKLVAGIDTTTEEDARMLAIEIRRTKEVLAAAMTIAITPSSLQISLACFQTLQWEIYALVWFTRSTLAIPEELLAIMGKPFYASFSLWLAIVSPCRTILAVSPNSIGSTISHVYSRAFFKSHYDFCLAVHIPVVTYDILLVVLEVAHVRTTVHPPENLTVLLQTGQHSIFLGLNAIDGRSILRIKLFTFLLVGELHENLQLAIAIHISTAGIVRDIS